MSVTISPIHCLKLGSFEHLVIGDESLQGFTKQEQNIMKKIESSASMDQLFSTAEAFDEGNINAKFIEQYMFQNHILQWPSHHCSKFRSILKKEQQQTDEQHAMKAQQLKKLKKVKFNELVQVLEVENWKDLNAIDKKKIYDNYVHAAKEQKNHEESYYPQQMTQQEVQSCYIQ